MIFIILYVLNILYFLAYKYAAPTVIENTL